MKDKTSFHEASTKLLREAFEGIAPDASGTWFVQGNEGILNSLKDLTAVQASIVAAPGLASIGAHTYHLIYAMSWANACHGGTPPTGTWEDTWHRNEFTEDEWAAMVKDLRTRFEEYLDWFKLNKDWSQGEGVIAVLSILPHVAYHLGAIRQLLAFTTETHS